MSFLSNLGSSLTAAIIFALLVFWIKEKLDPSKKVQGYFSLFSKTTETTQNSYIDMWIRRDIILSFENKAITGTSEKIEEFAPNSFINNEVTEVFRYKPHDRVMGTITGGVERNYLGSSKLHLILSEDNKISRKSSTYIVLDLGFGTKSKKSITGTFRSTVAKSSGDVWMQKKN